MNVHLKSQLVQPCTSGRCKNARPSSNNSDKAGGASAKLDDRKGVGGATAWGSSLVQISEGKELQKWLEVAKCGVVIDPSSNVRKSILRMANSRSHMLRVSGKPWDFLVNKHVYLDILLEHLNQLVWTNRTTFFLSQYSRKRIKLLADWSPEMFWYHIWFCIYCLTKHQWMDGYSYALVTSARNQLACTSQWPIEISISNPCIK